MKIAVVLDLNGTLVTLIQVEHPSELVEFHGAINAVRRLTQAGYVCPVVTIQSHIEKGVFSAKDFHAWFETLRARGCRHLPREMDHSRLGCRRCRSDTRGGPTSDVRQRSPIDHRAQHASEDQTRSRSSNPT